MELANLSSACTRRVVLGSVDGTHPALAEIHGRHHCARPDPLETAESGEDPPQELDALQLEKHPDKTFIGRIEKGFDFLGYRFTPRSLTVARKTIENFLERALRLYEQELGGRFSSRQLESYVARWRRWATAGL